jgi:hypothetical protein
MTMINYIELGADGRIVRGCSANLQDLDSVRAVYAGELIEVAEPLFDCNGHYWDGQAVQPKPAQPSPYHVFDWSTKTWGADLEAIRTAKRGAIEAQRELQIYAPLIVYDSINLDADARSQRNITEKLNDIALREQESDPMPAEMLMWRDADNVDHTFETQAAYRSWLNGLAIALGLRGTQAYAWSWAKKAALDALGNDVEALLAFDATT